MPKPILAEERSLDGISERDCPSGENKHFHAVLIKHAMAFAIHKCFNDKGFYYLHAPIITSSDAEGAGEMLM